MFNKKFLIGRTTADPNLNKTKTGVPVISFSLATNFTFKDKSKNQKTVKTEFHTCVAWKGTAETISRLVGKGSLVFIEGYDETRSWIDEESGKKVFKTETIVEKLLMLSTKPVGEGSFDEEPQESIEKDDFIQVIEGEKAPLVMAKA